MNVIVWDLVFLALGGQRPFWELRKCHKILKNAKSAVKHMGLYPWSFKSVIKYLGPYAWSFKSVVRYVGPYPWVPIPGASKVL